MKRLANLLIVVALFSLTVSCQKDPDFDELSTEFLTYTNYEKSAKFSSFSTFYISDTIKVMSSKIEKWYDDDNARSIISAVAANMKERGYTQLGESEKMSADLGIQLTYIENSYYVTDYYSPYWYDYWYDWWWGYSYWPTWGPVYPSYAVTYRYDIGSLLGEMMWIDRAEEKIKPVWSMCVGGAMSGSTRNDVKKAIRGVNQAFVQSPYIKK